MEAIFLVGGKGTRLHPLTLETPKPMLKVAGVPFIAHQIGYAKEHGVTRIVMAISYKNEQFLDYLGDGKGFGVEIIHAIEDQPLGTAGAIRNASRYLESDPQQPIAILNGDILSAHDMREQVALHNQMRADATLHLIRVADARPYGSVPTDAAGKIEDFVEKSDNPPTDFINAYRPNPGRQSGEHRTRNFSCALGRRKPAVGLQKFELLDRYRNACSFFESIERFSTRSISLPSFCHIAHYELRAS
jgi:mannose-1-phosphate guanylyltransferase